LLGILSKKGPFFCSEEILNAAETRETLK